MGERYTSDTASRKVADVACERAAAALRDGSVVAYPTETFYALGAHPRRPAALQQVLALKGRDAADKPLLLLIDDIARVDDWVRAAPVALQPLARHFWPGPLTLVMPAAPGAPEEITGGGSTIALRLTSLPLARDLIGRCGGALTGTSANPAGAPPAVDPPHVRAGLGDAVDILDGGTTPGGAPSTLLDLSGTEPRILRNGAVPADDIFAVLRLL